MTATSTQSKQKLTFEKFIEYPLEDGRYELVNGEIVKILATRQHDDIADFLADLMKAEVNRLNLNYKVSGRIMIATTTKDGKEQGRFPDASVVSVDLWRSNRLAYSALRDPLQLAVEVVSTNWEDDYIDKLGEYQRLGISEYWIVDYLAIGSRDYLGNPKVPTFFVHQLNADGVYEVTPYRGSDRIVSPTFPELELTIEQILSV
jgi:Uma2 family endonuclease